MNVVLITGAASGLGWALARAFYQRGDALYLVDRDADLLTQRCRQLDDPQRVAFQVADLGDDSAVANICAGLEQHYDRLDVLVNNAGITHRSLAASTDPAVLRKVMRIDWQAPVELALALLPKLKASRGSIINMGSMAGWMPVLGRAGYCSAKSALSQFFEVLRAEEQDSGLHVLMVYPAFINTAIEQNALGGDGNPARHARSTLGAIGEPEPLAADILRALERRRATLFPHRGIALASLLWRLAPGLFRQLMRRRFAVELEQR